MNSATATKTISQLIADAYSRDLEKPELKRFKEVVRISRKFGFPMVCTLGQESDQEQFSWAARLLLEVASTWPPEDIPATLELEHGTALFNDARQLLADGLSAARQLR